MVEGFQRGSKQMGVPTANVAPLSVEAQFEGRPKGVYFGWAQLQGASGEGDGAVHPMVLNYGVRPTIKDGSNVTVRSAGRRLRARARLPTSRGECACDDSACHRRGSR